MNPQIEVHSADGKDYIYHPEDHRWFVVWREKMLKPHHRTRELARRRIRNLKKSPQLEFDFS
jgi:hypothetical protein